MCRLFLTELDWTPPAGRVIPAWQLSAQLQQVDDLRSANRQASAIINAARRKAQKLIQEATKSCQQMERDKRHRLEALQRDTIARSKAQWLQQHITCLVRDEEQERALVNAVADRIRRSMEQVLSAWFASQPLDKTLCARLACQAQEMAQEGVLTLHIHPSMLASVRAEFGSRFVLASEPGYAPDSAVLASTRLSVSFSLSEHRRQLLEWLGSGRSNTGEHHEDSGHNDPGQSRQWTESAP